MSDILFENLTRQVAISTGASRQQIEDILSHQWKSVAIKIKTSMSVEISGIGHFKCSHHRLKLALRRAQRIMISYQAKLPNCSPSRTSSLAIKINSCQALIDGLENRIIKYESRLERPATGNVQLQARQKMD